MKIIILGAGKVGTSVANVLASENSDVTVVDTDKYLLMELQNRLDINTVVGNASFPSVLRRAGAADADMLIAVTSSDETNIVACQVAHTLFKVPTKVARIRSPEYLSEEKLFSPDHIPVDVLISPEQIMAQHIERLIEFQGAFQVLDFAGGRVQLVSVKAYHDGPLVGHKLRTLKEHMPGVRTKVVVIYRQGQAIIPTGDTVIQANDDVFFIANKKDIFKVMSELRHIDKPVKKVLLAGGGHIGALLAQALETRYQVKLIERNKERVAWLAEHLNNTIVLHGDVADEELLEEENIDKMDVFCAITNDDEANILSCVLAKRMGAQKVMAIINRTAYMDLMDGAGIDVAISPRQVTIGTLLAHVRKGDVVAVHSLRKGAAEAIEAVAHGDKNTSKVVGRGVDELKLPPGSNIGAVVRGDEVMILQKNVVIEAGDHVILFLTDKKCISAVEELFQVGVGFI